MSPFIFIIIIAVVIAFIVISYLQNQKRIKEWQQFATNHGLSFQRYDSIGLPDRYAFYHLFQQGHSKKAYNLCMGKESSFGICSFDYQYTTGSGKNQQIHYYTGLMVDTNLIFKSLFIRPEGFFDKIAAAVGFDDIDFESAEFSKRYFVKCEDKKFAYDIIHARMMEFLLQCQYLVIEARGRDVLYHRRGRLSPSEMEVLLLEAKKFFELTPDYVRKEIELGAGKQ